MSCQPVARMLLTVACGADILLQCGAVLDIGMAFETCDLIVGYVILVHEAEVVIFFYSVRDIMAGEALALRDNIIRTC